jgi:glutathione S-transferase
MFESAAICLQIGELYPDTGLLPPPGSSARALVYQWVLFGMTELEAPLYRWIGDTRDGRSDSPGAERFTAAAEVIATAVTGNEWLSGEQFTVADIVCAGVLGGAASRGLLQPWPVLQDYVERAERRPAHVAATAYGTGQST